MQRSLDRGVMGRTRWRDCRIDLTDLGPLDPAEGLSEMWSKLARFRKPSNLSQALWGGWTCHGCGTELNRKEK